MGLFTRYPKCLESLLNIRTKLQTPNTSLFCPKQNSEPPKYHKKTEQFAITGQFVPALVGIMRIGVFQSFILIESLTHLKALVAILVAVLK